MEKDRAYLEKGAIIRLSRQQDGNESVEFKIKGVVGEGGSSICYSAVRGDNKTGRLKEFYPIPASVRSRGAVFKRTESNQLVPTGGIPVRRLKLMQEDFIRAYITLDEIKCSNEQNEILNNFIPSYEIYYGECINGCSGIYIWTPDDKTGKGFDIYLDEVHNNPHDKPGQKLYDILSTVITLTDCICAMHMAGLLHLDIKPSNFLVTYDSRKNINTGSISLFDINTIYLIGSGLPPAAGTNGYRAPEVVRGRAENRSDIYSIGALLFESVVVDKSLGGRKYKDEYYRKLDNLVSSSELIEGSDINSNIYLKSVLAEILKKCLARNTRNRYGSCEELIDDLKRARMYLLPAQAGESLGPNMRIQIVETESQIKCDPGVVMHNLLYNNPLYSTLPGGADRINILIAGGGTYAQKFADICLQAAQMDGIVLNVNMLSGEAEFDKKLYMQFRPAISHFVNINGSFEDDLSESYGNLNFDSIPGAYGRFSKDSRAVNTAIVEEIKKKYTDINYVFIALGDDELNYSVAKAFSGDERYSVNFIWTGRERSFECANPVYINDNNESSKSISPSLERMAFNTHLCWNMDIHTDMTELKKQFYEKYYYSASVASALSIKYKLYSIGIDTYDTDAAAAEFAELAGGINNDGVDVVNRLAALEHRRWVLNRVTKGWTAPLDANGEVDYDYCVRKGSVKDEKNKLHPCIVRSRVDSPLSSEAYSENYHMKWHEPADKNLDELDTVSIKLHQAFWEKSMEYRQGNFLFDGDIAYIGNLVSEADKPVVFAYNRFIYCLKNILAGSTIYSRQYNHFEKSFKDSLKTMGNDARREISFRLDHIRRCFFTVIESNMYRNYKEIDRELIEKIPFILTFRPQPVLAMAFYDGMQQRGSSEARINNVVSATVINPSKLCYLYYYNSDADASMLAGAIKAVMNYYDNKNICCKIDFMAVTDRQLEKSKREELIEALRQIKTERFDFSVYKCDGEEGAAELFIKELKKKKPDLFDGSNPILPSHMINGGLIKAIADITAYCEFDYSTMQFKNCIDCSYLKYIDNSRYMRVEDMFSLQSACDNSFNLPEFDTDYNVLWQLYTGSDKGSSDEVFCKSVGVWNSLCRVLDESSKQHDKITAFELGNRSSTVWEYMYFMPSFCYKTVCCIINKMKKFGLVEAKSAVIRYATDTCKIMICTYYDVKNEMDLLFSNPYRLADADNMEVAGYTIGNTKFVSVSFNNLEAWGIDLKKNEDAKELLRALADNKFINLLRQHSDGSFSFVYTSPRMKKMLTTAGEILEVYTYYEALMTGYFDDVVCGYNFKWDASDTTNEIDCVMTKGFGSLIVECKARRQLSSEFYFRLDSLSRRFGVGSKMVLIANTYGGTEQINARNALSMNKGKRMQIITVSSPEDIRNIGQTLIKIAQGEYKQ